MLQPIHEIIKFVRRNACLLTQRLVAMKEPGNMIEVMQDGAFIAEEVSRAGGGLLFQKRIEPGAGQRKRQLISIETKPLKAEGVWRKPDPLFYV